MHWRLIFIPTMLLETFQKITVHVLIRVALDRPLPSYQWQPSFSVDVNHLQYVYFPWDSIYSHFYSLFLRTLLHILMSCSLFKQGHHGCVNAVAWNSNGSLLISGSDDTRV